MLTAVVPIDSAPLAWPMAEANLSPRILTAVPTVRVVHAAEKTSTTTFPPSRTIAVRAPHLPNLVGHRDAETENVTVTANETAAAAVDRIVPTGTAAPAATARLIAWQTSPRRMVAAALPPWVSLATPQVALVDPQKTAPAVAMMSENATVTPGGATDTAIEIGIESGSETETGSETVIGTANETVVIATENETGNDPAVTALNHHRWTASTPPADETNAPGTMLVTNPVRATNLPPMRRRKTPTPWSVKPVTVSACRKNSSVERPRCKAKANRGDDGIAVPSVEVVA